MNCCNITIIISSLIGAVLVILGAVLGFSVLPDYVEDEIAKQVRLEDDTEQFDRWAELPFAMTFKVYLFEVENPDEVLEGATPKVIERGPYVYDLNRHKEDIVRNAEEDTLTYRQMSNYKFNAALSGDNKEEDEFYVLNAPLYGFLQNAEPVAGHINPYWEEAFVGYETKGPFVKIKVGDWLFKGTKFCDMSSSHMACDLVKDVADQIKMLEIDGDGVSFAFFKFKDNADDGTYTIKAGMDVVEDLGLIKSWNGITEQSIWETEGTCNAIVGRDSAIYPPYIEEEDYFDIYSTDICRVVRLEFTGEETYKEVDGQRRQLRKDTLSNKDSNSCFCTKAVANIDGSKKECLPEGFNDLYMCTGSHVALSFPHFLWADEETAKTVEGLNPIEEDHVTFVVVEPGTGYPLRGAKRVQFNMVLRAINKITALENVKGAMFPLVWVEEGVELPDDLIEELDDKYLSKLVLIDAVTWTLIAVGIVVFIGFGAWFIFRRK